MRGVLSFLGLGFFALRQRSRHDLACACGKLIGRKRADLLNRDDARDGDADTGAVEGEVTKRAFRACHRKDGDGGVGLFGKDECTTLEGKKATVA